MADQLFNGQRFRLLTLVENFSRESLAIQVGTRLTGDDVVAALDRVKEARGCPQSIRVDNGPEFISKAIQSWLKKLQIETLYVTPGSPWENGFVESFHSRLRDEFLALEEFESLRAARTLTQLWKDDYNHHRPHSSLDYQTPAEYAARCVAPVPEKVPPTAPPSPPLQQHNETYLTLPS